MHYRIIERPQPQEYAAYYHDYVVQIPEDSSILHRMESQIQELRELASHLPGGNAGFRYAEGKWSLAEVVGHIIDSERIFATRALVFSRNDPTEYPGFEQDDYVVEANSDNRPFSNLVDEFEYLRRGNILMFHGMTDEMLLRKGVANNNRMSVRGVVWVMAGHVSHHIRIIRERYL